MSKQQNVCKFTISMETDLLVWVEQKVVEINARDRRYKSSRSAVIAHAVQAMKDLEHSKLIEPLKKQKKGEVLDKIIEPHLIQKKLSKKTA